MVLILTQSYTASLTSMLTVQQLKPTVSDVSLLLKNGDVVGYQEGSLVYDILRQLGFRDEKLKTYDSPKNLHKLFQLGSTNNGISAAFDETPYMKLFLASYCSRYTMHDPTFKADGFAFVFPKDSPLARDVSRAILNVNEGGKAKKIEEKWFDTHPSCPDQSSKAIANSLNLKKIWCLFLIAGIASVLALLIFLYVPTEPLRENNEPAQAGLTQTASPVQAQIAGEIHPAAEHVQEDNNQEIHPVREELVREENQEIHPATELVRRARPREAQ